MRQTQGLQICQVCQQTGREDNLGKGRHRRTEVSNAGEPGKECVPNVGAVQDVLRRRDVQPEPQAAHPSVVTASGLPGRTCGPDQAAHYQVRGRP